MRITRFAASLALSALLLGSLRGTGRAEPNRPRIPDEATAVTLEGKTASLADYKGKLIFLNVWKTDCRACLLELPVLNRLHREYSSESFAVIGIAMDRGKDRYVAELADMVNLEFPVWLGYGQPIAEYVEVPVTPVLFFVAPNGEVLGYLVGAFPTYESAVEVMKKTREEVEQKEAEEKS